MSRDEKSSPQSPLSPNVGIDSNAEAKSRARSPEAARQKSTRRVTPRSLRRSAVEYARAAYVQQEKCGFTVQFSKKSGVLRVTFASATTAPEHQEVTARRYLETLVKLRRMNFNAFAIAPTTTAEPCSGADDNEPCLAKNQSLISAIGRNWTQLRLWGGETHLAKCLVVGPHRGRFIFI